MKWNNTEYSLGVNCGFLKNKYLLIQSLFRDFVYQVLQNKAALFIQVLSKIIIKKIVAILFL